MSWIGHAIKDLGDIMPRKKKIEKKDIAKQEKPKTIPVPEPPPVQKEQTQQEITIEDVVISTYNMVLELREEMDEIKALLRILVKES